MMFRSYSLIIAILIIANLVYLNDGTNEFWYRNNVCKTLEDYRTVYRNKNCSYDPDVGSSPKLIAKRYGFRLENHQVTTQDGYILTLHHIRPRDQEKSNIRRQPVLIIHGIAGVSIFWMMQKKRSIGEPKNFLNWSFKYGFSAFFLSNNGYDVWLGNLRGNYYSDKHVNQSISNADYWNFSFHENAIYDLPAFIDLVAEKTSGKGDLVYIGHSMGTTASYIYSSLMSRHAQQNLKVIISLAPIAYMGHVSGSSRLLARPAKYIARNFWSQGVYVLFEQHAFQKLFLGQTCGKYPFIVTCSRVLETLSGFAPKEFQAELLPLFLDIYPSAVSVKTFLHFSQLITSQGMFQMYDFGPKKNQEVYNNSTVPLGYDVGKITVPIHLFAGIADFLAPVSDVKTLADKLYPTQVQIYDRMYTFPFAHNDFFMSKHVDKFYKTLLRAIRQP